MSISLLLYVQSLKVITYIRAKHVRTIESEKDMAVNWSGSPKYPLKLHLIQIDGIELL
jgi:hypothetical protein